MPELYSAKSRKPESNRHSDDKHSEPLSRNILHTIKQDLNGIKTGRFSGFSSFPKSVKFETQESKEEIILLLRRHFVTNIPWILVVVFMVIAPLIFPISTLLSFLPISFQVMTVVVWYLGITAILLEKFLSWYFNVYIVTDERIVDVDFYSLIYKRISETKIDKIEDVTYSQGGFVQSMFNYGTVNIQTAGEVTEFEFEFVPYPAKVAKVINQLVIQEEQEKIEGRVS